MSTHSKSGFTIIEVMLFLAITGAMTVALLVGSGAAINRQRYRDSVNSFKGVLQEQYSRIANVVNSEVEKPTCTVSGSALVIPDGTENKQARGTSDCLVVGRFVLVEPTQVTAYNLIGRPPSAKSIETSDSATLAAYSFATQTPETQEVSWNASIVEPKTTKGSTTSILIIRSPLSGSILTYVKNGDNRSDIRGMIADGNMKQKDFCVDSGGLIATGRRMVIRLGARAANQSAVEIPLETDGVCD